MIGTLTGVIEEIESDHLILNVGGIGYIVFASSKSLSECSLKEIKRFFIEVHAQKDKPDILFGFLEREEQNCLRLLIKVSGISYKTGISILSKITPEQIFQAISEQNKILLKIGGISAKMIDRIITELHSEVSKMNLSLSKSIVNNDAISALVSLGYNSISSYNTVKKLQSTYPELDTQGIIVKALRELA